MALVSNRRSPDQRVLIIKTLLHAALLLPIAQLSVAAWQEQTLGNGALGADPIAAIEHALGIWALRILLLTLAMTPMSRVAKWPGVLRYRRLIGLYAFTYATLHLLAYVGLDLKGYWMDLGTEIIKRPYITVGFLAWLLLLVLAVTSPRSMVRQLGRRWKPLHRMIYPAAVLAVLHFFWVVKSDLTEPAMYGAVLAGLLIVRLPLPLAGRVKNQRHHQRGNRGADSDHPRQPRQ